ncbi:phosphate ABC transporter substrate-binding/OmpA family protein [Yoonia maricola]|nr:phosphate ABC transporter substrate-binding/OmpA family protein [Yoonia maricola]
MKTRQVVSMIAMTAAISTTSTAWASEITLLSADGAIDLVGELLDFSDNTYAIRTVLGDLSISASRVSCDGAACPVIAAPDADVVIAGSDTLGQSLMPLLLSGYAATRDAEDRQTMVGGSQQVFAEMIGDQGFGDPIGSYLISSSSSGDAFTSLADQSAQIGMASRRILPDEARMLRDTGAGNMIDPAQEHIIAIDSLIVITHPNNPVDTLTTNQLRQIYAGTITNWADVGGLNAPIQLIDRAEGAGARVVFENRLFGPNIPAVPASAVIATDNDEMAAIVNSNENAIGFTGFAFQRGAKPITLINDCGLIMTPDAFSVRTDEYALQQFLYLYNRGDLSDDTAVDFVNYAVSAEADDVIAKAGLIDLGVDRRAQAADGDRAQMLLKADVDDYVSGIMQDMLGEMNAYDRLSTTFRFRTGSSTLDPRGRLNLERLTDYLEAQPTGTRLLFVGFTDDVGAFDSNLRLSNNRAQQVMEELRTFAGDRLAAVEMNATGYGEIAPSACNTDENGRGINRRVEVWIQLATG